MAAVVNFAIALFVLWYFCRKPLAAFLFSRSDKLSQSIIEAKKLVGEAEQQLSEWERNFNESKSHAEEHFNEAKTALERFRQVTLKSTQSEVERLKKETTLAIQNERAKSKGLLQRELILKSVEMARRILSASLKDKDRTALVSDYSERLAHGTG